MLIIPFPLRQSQAITGNHMLSDAIRCSSSHYHSGNHMQSDALRCDHAQRGSAQSDEGCLRIPRKGWYKLEVFDYHPCQGTLAETRAIGGHRGPSGVKSGAIGGNQEQPGREHRCEHRSSEAIRWPSDAIHCHQLQSPCEDRRCEHLDALRVGAQLLDERLEGLGLRDGLTLR